MKIICFSILIVGILSVNHQTSTVPNSVRQEVYKKYTAFLGKTLPEANHTFIAPGLGQNYVPQGFGETPNSYIVSAYYSKYGSTAKQNSMLYLISKSTGKVTKALKLDTKGHVGGIAASSKNVYVCLDKQIGSISLSTISKAKEGDLIKFAKKYAAKTTCSFASYYKDRLYAGSFDKSSAQNVYAYTVGDTSLTVKAKYKIPKKIQGFTVLSDTKIAASQSYGRGNDAALLVYTVSNAFKDIDLTSKSYKKYILPPMSEGIFKGSDGNLYIIFESGANYYYAGPKAKGASYCKKPMDRVVAVSIKKI
ncbi:MAG: hypothetical protein MJ252_04775 [archaeon]|nr:hypothetical protein [archaeon]